MSPSFLRAFAALIVFCFGQIVLGEDEDFTRVDPERWEVRAPGPGAGFQLLDHALLSFHRLQLINRSEWNGGTISLDLKPLPGVRADDDRIYGDQVVVFLSSDGSFRKERSYETLSGLVIRIDTVTGDIYIQVPVDGVTFENLAFLKGTGPLDPEQWHRIVITDKVTTVLVTVDDANLVFDGKDAEKAELLAAARKGKRWGFYGREAVGPGMRGSYYRRMSWSAL